MNNPATAQPVVMAESELTYVPHEQSEDQVAFDKSLKDVISEIEDEFNGSEHEFTDEELADGPAEGPEPELPAPVVDGEQEQPDDPAVARGMERLVAREVALQAKEAAISQREAEYNTLKNEVVSLRSALPSAKLMEQFDLSPTEAIKALGKDPQTVVRLMIAEQLEAKGEEVPEELRKFVEKAATQREINALRSQIEQQNRATEAQAVFNAVNLGAREYVKEIVGQAKTMPTLAGIASANPDHAHLEIMEEIKADARERMAADPNGQPLTYAEAAKRVEARLSKLKSLFTPGPAQNAPTKPAQGAKVTPPQTKPAAAPLKPWQKKDDDLYAQGLKEAEREFYRQEAIARQRRR